MNVTESISGNRFVKLIFRIFRKSKIIRVRDRVSPYEARYITPPAFPIAGGIEAMDIPGGMC